MEVTLNRDSKLEVIVNGAAGSYMEIFIYGGGKTWKKCYGGSNDFNAMAIVHTLDGGYAVAGITKSIDGGVSGNNGNWDMWVLKLNEVGNVLIP